MTNQGERAYPLQWPHARPRTPDYRRKAGNFSKKESAGKKDLTIADAMRRLQDEIDRIGATSFVLSANLVRNVDGSPRSNQSQPADPGAALYFQLKGKPHCLPCDTYSRVEQNIAALAKHIEATRAIERYGVANMAEMFTGFTALPAPKSWQDIFGIAPGHFYTIPELDSRYRQLAKRWTEEGRDLTELNVARDKARIDLAKIAGVNA